MAAHRIPLPAKSEKPKLLSSKNLDKYLHTAEKQRVLAREMIEKVQQMCERATEMKKPPRLIFP